MTSSQSSNIQTSKQTSSVAAIYLCFVLSGAAALIYQTAWTRQFALLFGTSELAVAAVLAAYMGGLALGAFLIERWLARIERPVQLYAILEVGIAASALLLMPLGLAAAELLLTALLGDQANPPGGDHAGNSFFYLLSSFLVLMAPTTLMGATLPLLARHAVHSEEEIGRRIGILYASNTAGAVAGALLAALLLLPKLGLSKTIWTAAGLNLAVAGLAQWLAKRSPSGPVVAAPAQAAPERPRFEMRVATVWVLPLMLLSGAISFLHEVLWTRMLSHVLGSSIYAFGVMVASFLAGIALGGGVGAWLARSQAKAMRWLAISELAAAAAAAGAWYAILHWIPTNAELSGRVVFGLLLLLPLTFAIGLTYPLAVRVLASDVRNAAPSSARVYAWNTVGAILGAIGGGFVLIPALRYEGATQFAVIASCVLAICAATTLLRPSKFFAWSVGIVAVLGMALFHPQRPETLLRLSPIQVSGAGEMVYYDVGRSADVVVLRQGNRLMLRTNGLPEASMDAPGSVPLLNVEAWMAPLAVLARPNATSMLIVGLGAGRVVDAVPPGIQSIDLIELEPKVVAANQAVRNLRQYDPLADTRVKLILNDARGSLSLTNKRYDSIVSQPSHPWTAGASHLYTREFMQQARDHLAPGGVFVQWMNTDFLDEHLFRSLLATLADVFPHVRVYRPAPTTLLFLASSDPIEPERQLAATQTAFARSPGRYARIGLNAPEDLVASLIMDNEAVQSFIANAPLITDDANRFATDAVYDFGRNIRLERIAELLAPYDPLTRADSFIYRELGQKLAFDYIGRRLALTAATDSNAYARLNGMAKVFGEADLSVYLNALSAFSSKQQQAGQQILQIGLDMHPQSNLLLAAFLDAWIGALAYDKAPAEVVALSQRLSGDGAVILKAARHAAHNEWDAVANLDEALAQVPWTSLWNGQATQLRTEWRSRVRNPELRQRLGDEAVAIIDRLVILEPNIMLLAQRAWNSVGADRPQVLLESISQFANATLAAADNMDAGMRPAIRNHVESLGKVLDELASDRRLNATRVSEVRGELASARRVVGID